MALFMWGLINSPLAGLRLVLEHPWALVACVGVLGSPLTHLSLIVFIWSSEWVILVWLHREVASSGTRWSSCKSVVLVTLGGCHLLDGLVVVSVKACKKLVRRSREELCEGHCPRPAGAAKSNSSKECHWATLTCEVGSCGARRAGLAGDAN
jgi:hypothetical protein